MHHRDSFAPRPGARAGRHPRRLRVENLEDRRLLANAGVSGAELPSYLRGLAATDTVTALVTGWPDAQAALGERRIRIGDVELPLAAVTAAREAPSLAVSLGPYVETKGLWFDFDTTDGIQGGVAPALSWQAGAASAAEGKLTLPGVWFEPVLLGGQAFARLSIAGGSSSDRVGEPELPVIRRLLTAPADAEFRVEVTGQPRTLGLAEAGIELPLAPRQAPVSKMLGGSELVPVRLDAAAYLQDAFTPQPVVRMSDAGSVDGRRLVLLEIAPLAYNPVRQAISVYDTLTFAVHVVRGSKGGDGSASGGTFGEWEPSAGGGGQAKGGRLLIIAHDALAGAAELTALINHKISLGWTVDLANTATVGTTTTAIKSYIQGRYDNVATRPAALLLVGDTGQIPQFIASWSEDRPDTDLYYTCMDAGDDWLPEFPVGRFSVTSTTELDAIVDKTIAYETAASAAWMKKAVFMSSADNYSITEGTHNDVISTWLEPQGYTSDKLYSHTYSATTQQVRDALNSGRALAVYSGHGSEYAWTDGPYFSQTSVRNLANAGMYPLVASFACLTGDYSRPESFAETWQRVANKGAVDMLASSVTSYWTEDDILEKRLFAAIYDENETEFGRAILRAKELYLEYFGATAMTRRYFEMYNLFGDPTVRLHELQFGIASPADLPAAYRDEPYQYTLAAGGGITPYTWSLLAGVLPAGLSLNPTTGLICGTPTETGTFPFSIQVQDAGTPPQTDGRQFTLAVGTRPPLSVTLPADASEGDPPVPAAVGIPAALGSDLTVTLQSSDPAEATVMAQVTIPAGQVTATFLVTIGDDALRDGTQQVTLRLTAAGYAAETADLAVHDNDVHHFAFSTISDLQIIRTPFDVTITAQDVNNQTILAYDGIAALTAAGDQGDVPITLGGAKGSPLDETPVQPQPDDAGGKYLGVYHTYAQLSGELNAYAAAYPGISRLYQLGTSVQGRNLWALKITDNPTAEEDEPEFYYASTLHGNEQVGMEMCLYLIDELLSKYATDSRVQELVDETEIWIVPLANPDGREANTRYNANGVDLNRDFPEGSPPNDIGTIFAGPPLDTAGRQPETVALMQWNAAHRFVASANFHTGALVVNYPYDNDGRGSVDSPTPDDALFETIAEVYSSQNLPMWNSTEFTHGITNGAAWYAIDGGLQDWTYRYLGNHHLTIELSDVFQPPASQLPAFWDSNRESMLSYLETAGMGIRGVVTDLVSGQPVSAQILVQGNTQPVFTDPDVGDYHRLLLPGTYTLTVSAAGYQPRTVPDIAVGSGGATRIDVSLVPLSRGVSFSQGVWTGTVSAETMDTNVRLEIRDGGGGNGSSNRFDIVSFPTFQVTQFTATRTGFVAQLSHALDTSVVNLYDGAAGTLGPPDVLVVDGAGQAVAGSLVVDDNRRVVRWVATGNVLPAGTYTVTLTSGPAALRDVAGDLLDGDGNGTAGDDFRSSVTVAAVTERVLSIPDLARGAGQLVNIPFSATGLPIRLDNADGVTSLAVDLVYDEELLEITAASKAAGLPGDWSVVTPPDTSTPGVAKIRASGTTALSGTNVEIVRLTAAVPTGAPYGEIQALRLENISLNGGAIAAVGDVAVHKAVYLGDADGSGIHSSADAFLTVQAALGLASGFAAHAWTDPRIVGAADGSGVLSAADAFLIVQEGLGLSEPFVPDNPHITITPVGGGIDPQFRIDVDLPASAGGLVSVPVKLAIEAAATNVGALDFELFFDPARLTIQLSGGVSAGADTAGWAVSAILVAPGQLRVGMMSSDGRPLPVGLREIARLRFEVEGGKSSRTGWQPIRDGLPTRPTLLRPVTDYRSPITDFSDGSETHPTWLDIEPVDRRAGGYTWTDADGSVLIRPAERALAAATRERVWRDVDAKADLLESVLADLVQDLASAWR